MKKLKLSEIREAIKNRAIEIDLDTDNFDVLLMIQDATDEEKAEVNTLVFGDDERLASMLAYRMMKDECFNAVIKDAVLIMLENKYGDSLNSKENLN